MYKTLLVVAAVVAFAVVGALHGVVYPAKELARVKNERITAVVFDKQCTHAGILAQFAAMGAPEEVVAGLKAGIVQAVGEKEPTDMCATKEGPMGEFPGSYFIVDALGNDGYLSFEGPKPMKHDNPLPGQLGT